MYYATKNPKTAQRNYKLHNPHSSLMIGDVNDDDVVKETRKPSYIDTQQKLI